MARLVEGCAGGAAIAETLEEESMMIRLHETIEQAEVLVLPCEAQRIRVALNQRARQRDMATK